VLLNAAAFSHREIHISTAEPAVAKRISTLLRLVFSVECGIQEIGTKFHTTLESPCDIERIFNALGYDFKNHVSYHVNRNIIEDDCCMVSFIRGAFLLSGTVAGPGKKSHLEFRSAKRGITMEESSLLLDIGFSPKITTRQGSYVLYFKESASVESLIKLMGASGCAEKIMRANKEKELRNTVNRQVNCEAANLAKSADAAARQTQIILAALSKRGEEVFPEKLRETVRLRLRYPEIPLSELAQKFNPPISKPGLGHRLKKIIEIAEIEIAEKED